MVKPINTLIQNSAAGRTNRPVPRLSRLGRNILLPTIAFFNTVVPKVCTTTQARKAVLPTMLQNTTAHIECSHTTVLPSAFLPKPLLLAEAWGAGVEERSAGFEQ